MKLLTVGTFDIPHLGHAFLLQQCRRLAEEVVVGVNSDRFVLYYKGSRPTFLYAERAALIAAMGYEVRPNDGPGRELILSERPDILAIGFDWASDRQKDYFAQIDVTSEELSSWGITLAFIPTLPLDLAEKLGATQIRERLA